MTKTQRKKAVAIAHDVLAQMKARKIAATPGEYFAAWDPTALHKAGESLQKVLPRIKKCNVCALGACFYSHITLHNRFKLDSGGSHLAINGGTIRDQLGLIFSGPQLVLIESAFEWTSMQSCSGEICDKAEVDAAINFGQRYVNPALRLRAIMKNIIKNDGEFVL